MNKSLESKGKYPENNIDLKLMNRVLRHRLRNLCAGVKMTMDRIASVTKESHPELGGRCDIIKAELDNLQAFTERMDLLFDALPSPESASLFTIISGQREDFAKEFPFCALDLNGPELDASLIHGSWVSLALKELISNAGEAAGSSEGTVSLTWNQTADCPLEFTIENNGSGLPEEIPATPPEPFNTQKSRHDGIGMAMAFRIFTEIGAEMKIDKNREHGALVHIKLPKEELLA
jgi:two-component system nitrogen regulation sensor histidine kinase GlnL